jgi:hypothetical protein
MIVHLDLICQETLGLYHHESTFDIEIVLDSIVNKIRILEDHIYGRNSDEE